MSQIKTFEEACQALGIDPAKPLVDASGMPEKHRKAIEAHAKLVVIAEALNDGWQPDWSDEDQYKYFPWFEVEATEENRAGSGFSYTYYVISFTFTNVGSRLCYATSALARYAGETFADLYREYMLIGQ
ncbi:MAG: hypothetical protein FD166_3579 [Bacteroidetes bacterium]|nr:MAG: hypothetical protein FD166_3579 [Bacteroidota bacterium]